MTKTRRERTILGYIGITAALLFFIAGCAGSRLKGSDSASSGFNKENKGAAPLYYDFGDVLIPSELKVDKKSSFVTQSSGLSAGVLSLKGRVEIGSLIAFFESNMSKDNWRLISSFKYMPTMMLFKKENRWCVINISEQEFYTYVDIWVAPTVNEAGSGLLK